MKKDSIIEILKNTLSEERFSHTLGTAKCAVELAKMYGLDEEKAELAGLLHDNAKCLSNEELRKIIDEKFPEIPECELMNYKTYHAPCGAYFAQEKFGVEDNEIIRAIKVHTLGAPDMSLFDMIIFLADKIEENTRDLEYREKILKILDENKGEIGLKKALFVCFSETIKSLVKRKLLICPTTIEVYNFLLKEVSKN